MHYLIRILFSISLLWLNHSYAQLESYNWYFGRNAGISFLPSGIPSALSNSAMNARFGSASISDSCNGQLLFYTDGDTVWTQNHQYMLNGTGLGGVNSTQSSLIVGKPASSNGDYYVFTVGTALNSGMSYSIVNMNLSGGMGGVVPGQKKISLVPNTLEKITAVRHSNNTDIWIITHTLNDDEFHTFLLSKTSISSPVVTKVGPIYTTNDLKGYMKASPDGSMICLALDASSRFDLYDFDNTTGRLSNQRSSGANFPFAFGVEFSPDASKLYVTGDPVGLHQFDLTTANPGSPLGNSTLIHNTGQIKALQIGPDGKIYVNEAFTLGVVNDPNNAGLACNYQSGVITLSGFGNNALPSFMQSYFTLPTIVAKNLCLGIATEFGLTINSNVDSLLWNFGEPSSGPNNSSKLFDPAHLYADSGTYNITAYVFSQKCGIVKVDTVVKDIQIIARPIPIVNLGNDTIICEGDSLVLMTSGVEPSYLWNTGSTASEINAFNDDLYWVRATNECGSITDSIDISFFNSKMDLDLGNDTSICQGDDFILDAFQQGATSYLWNDSSTFQGLRVKEPGKYWVEVKDKCTVQSDTVVIGVKYKPVVDIGNDTTICIGEVLLLDATTANSTYEWHDGWDKAKYSVNEEGFYFVNVMNACGNTRSELYAQVKDCSCRIFVPNSFTPNGDRINEYFGVNAECDFIHYELRVFNRWGEQVYYTKNPLATWNGDFRGKPAISDTYTFQLNYVSNDPFDKESHEIKGHIMLIR